MDAVDSEVRAEPTLRVQKLKYDDGRCSWVVLDLEAGSVHLRAERFLAPLAAGTQRTYAYHLVDHLRWLARVGLVEDRIGLADLRRYMALCGVQHAGPLGVPWRDKPLSDSALAVRAACVRGYYLDLTLSEGINPELREALSQQQPMPRSVRNRSLLGHLGITSAVNPIGPGTVARRHPRMLPDGARAAMLASVRTTRDRMIVTWLSDSGMRIGELCGLWFCDLHLRSGHECGQRSGPHVHIVQRDNPNGARAKTASPSRIVEGVVTGGTIRRVSPAMIDSYFEYLIDDYHRVRALAQHDLVFVHLTGATAGKPLSPHGARQMIERSGRRAGLGRVLPHAFRHTWATALTQATGGNTKAVADEGGWASAATVDATYAHLAGDPSLDQALEKVWGSQ